MAMLIKTLQGIARAVVRPRPARVGFTATTHPTTNTLWGPGNFVEDPAQTFPGHGVTNPILDRLTFPKGEWLVEWKYDAPLTEYKSCDQAWVEREDETTMVAHSRVGFAVDPVRLSFVVNGPATIRLRYNTTQYAAVLRSWVKAVRS